MSAAHQISPHTTNGFSADALLTAHQVAELLGVSAEYVWQLSREGRIPTVSLGRARRYRLESILRWIEEIESRSLSRG